MVGFTGKIVAVAVAVMVAIVAVPIIESSALSPLTAITTIHDNSISVVYHSACPVSIDPSTPDYDAQDGTVTYKNVDYERITISNIDNANGGIADSDGNVNVSLNIPENTPFVIAIYNGEQYRIITYVSIDNVIINGEIGSHNYGANSQLSGYTRYLCHYTDGTEQWNRSNIADVINHNGWYYSNNGVVNISVIAHYDDGSGRTAQNVYLYVIINSQNANP